jgi:hypothetical protein
MAVSSEAVSVLGNQSDQCSVIGNRCAAISTCHIRVEDAHHALCASFRTIRSFNRTR